MEFQSQKEHLKSSMRRLGIIDAHVLDAIRKVPRENFVPHSLREMAYDDEPLPIGQGQTISQPSLVAYMTQKLSVQPHHRILEIGTGSGYQTAILAELCKDVYTIELIEDLSLSARMHLKNYSNIHYHVGDGNHGWDAQAPFDRIIVTAAAPKIPTTLMDQLVTDGVMVIPVATANTQKLFRIHKSPEAVDIERLMDVRFVDLISETQH